MRLRFDRQGCGGTVRDIFLYTLPVYLPFYQALLLHGMGRAMVFLLLAVLLLFIVAHSPEMGRALRACLKALCFPLPAPVRISALRGLAFTAVALPEATSSAALFQRPPPLFA